MGLVQQRGNIRSPMNPKHATALCQGTVKAPLLRGTKAWIT
jgi:hypothetical protein